MATRDILKTLKSEHNVLRDLFKQMEDTTDRAEKGRAELLEKIEANLMPHAKWEEIVFYPAFKERADRDGLKTHAEALLEHATVEETVIPNVKASDVATPEFHMRPGIIALPLDVTKDSQILLLSMLINLTPGSVALDVSPDRRFMYVHVMYMESADAARAEIKQGFERRVQQLLG